MKKTQTLFLLDEIEQLARALLDISQFLKQYRLKFPIANKIQLPKIPPALSERIAIDLIQRKAILIDEVIHECFLGGTVADVIAKTEDSRTLKIEVKSTGSSSFQNFTKKDIQADYLIWIHFDNFFYDEEKPQIEIFILKDPRSHYPVRDTRILLGLKDFIIKPVTKFSFHFKEFYNPRNDVSI